MRKFKLAFVGGGINSAVGRAHIAAARMDGRFEFVGGMFSRDALGLDLRQPFRIEPQRDASRGGGGWELNATIEFAAGVYRPTFGCNLVGTSS